MGRDERIQKFRLGLHPLFIPFYDALWRVAPIEFAPYFGLRSFDDQRALFSKGRDASGKIVSLGEVVTYAEAGQSAHNYGCACDVTVFDENSDILWLDKHDPKWLEFGVAVSKIGATWGGDFTGNHLDPGHFELPLKCAWSEVGSVYASDGEAVALRFITDNQL